MAHKHTREKRHFSYSRTVMCNKPLSESHRKNMTEKQIDILIYFVYRMPMYLYEVNRDSIVNFIHGFECGANSNNLTENISNRLEVTHKIKKFSMGWPNQLERYSENNSKTWTESFQEILIEVIRELPEFKRNHDILIHKFSSVQSK